MAEAQSTVNDAKKELKKYADIIKDATAARRTLKAHAARTSGRRSSPALDTCAAN